MRPSVIAGVLLITGCTAAGTTPTPTPAPTLNPTLLQDGQLFVDGLTALDAVAIAAGAPAADTALVGRVLSLAQGDLTALQTGVETPAAYASLITSDIQQFTPTFLADIKANASLTVGLTALENLVPALVQDASGQTVTATPRVPADPRATLRAWIASVKAQ
jgi:hypothetical protein